MSQSTCKSCGTTLHGEYCHECGEKVLTHKDRSILVWIENFVSGLWLLDGKVIRSFRYLLFKPGTYASDIYQGIRKRYLTPMQLFLIANLIYFLLPSFVTFKTTLDSQRNNLPYSRFVRDYIDVIISKSGEVYEVFDLTFNTQAVSLSKILIILMAPMFGAVVWVLYLRRKEFYLTDFFNLGLQFMAFFILAFEVLFFGLFWLLIWIFQPTFQITDQHLGVIAMVMTGLYLFFQLKGVFTEKGIWRILKVPVLIFSLIFLVAVYRFILLFATLWTI